jgi:glycosyltransferase involved in cell wall biosynthesis
MNKVLKTIVVDLTPVLPGGENGGAKIFVIELLHRLAELTPQIQYILLTQAGAHEELSVMERPNMRRLMLVNPFISRPLGLTLRKLATPILLCLPGRLKRKVSNFRYRLVSRYRNNNSDSLLRQLGADLLFCPFTAPTYFEPGVATVSTIHDLQYKTYPEFFSPQDVAHRDHIFIEACRRSSAIAVVSEYSKNVAIAHGKLKPSQIRTIHHRLADRILPEGDSNEVVLTRLKLTSQRYLIYPANFWKHKNHEMLLTAFGIACQEGIAADVKLVCTGAPSDRQAWLVEAVKRMQLAERVIFPGYLPKSELSILMANSRGMVFPSLYEGFGLPVIEAMASGVPVACSNTTSLPEVAADAAILFDPRVPTQISNAMKTLVDDDVLRVHLIEEGKLRAESFSDSERMAREYLDLFQFALNNAKDENLLTGVYSDSWSGPALNIHVNSANCDRNMEIEFSAPEWLPQARLTIKASRSGKPLGSPFELVRGSSARCLLPLEPEGGDYEIKISPTFVPAKSGHGDDTRELAAILKHCLIKHLDEENTEFNLYPEQDFA